MAGVAACAASFTSATPPGWWDFERLLSGVGREGPSGLDCPVRVVEPAEVGERGRRESRRHRANAPFDRLGQQRLALTNRALKVAVRVAQ